MMNNELQALIMGMIVGALISALFVSSIVNTAWKTATINRDLALYCPLNGNWAWKGECE